MVPVVRLELTRIATLDFESSILASPQLTEQSSLCGKRHTNVALR